MGNPPTITELIHDVEEGELILPEFQRGYVWTNKQVREYLDSLYRGYPTGNLLIWKTPNPGLVRKGGGAESRNVYQLILDGQQRLTSIYTLIKGEAPPFYEGESLFFDIYFNVITEEFSYYKQTIMRGSSEWVPVSPFLKAGVGGYLKTGGGLPAEHRDFLFNYYDRLQQLDAVKQYTYYPDYLNQREMDEVVRIFDLVNSRGTRLSKSDLALSHICASWPEARQIMKTAQTECAAAGFAFGLDFFVRCTSSVATQSGKYEPLYRTKIADIKAAWQRTSKALTYVLNVLRHEAYIDSAQSLSTDVALVPIVVYIANGPGKFPGEKMKRSFLHWLYLALMMGRYSGSTETKLSEDLQALKDEHPPDRLRDNILRVRGRLKVLPDDFRDRGIRSPLFHMAYIVARHAGAVDWFNGLPLYSQLIGKANGLHDHHIFPQSALYKKAGYRADVAADKNRVNEIANMAFLTAEANLKVAAQEPTVYLPKVLDQYPAALSQQFISDNPGMWALERYEDFLADRRTRLADAINSFLDGLLKYTGAKAPDDITALLNALEGPTLEFKSSLRWDYKEQKINKELERVAARTLAAFMNAEGGTLVVGVSPDRRVLGLDADLVTISQHDLDGWEGALRTALNNHLDKDVAAVVAVNFAAVDGQTVALVRADRETKPIFLRNNNQTEFHVRAGNRTEMMGVQEATSYIQKHFAPAS